MNLTALKTWVSGETLTATDLNGEFQNIYTHTITNSDIDSTGTYVLGELVVGSGITAADGGQFHVHTASAGSVQAHADANEAVLENSAASGLSILSGSSSDGNIFFGDAADNDIGKIAYSHSANSLAFTTNGATALTLSSAQAATFAGDVSVGGALTLTGGLTLNGAVVVGDSASDTLTVNATVTSNLLFTDNTYDIGASGATRPRDLFLSRNALMGGTLGVTGLITASGGLSGNVTGGTISGSTGSFTSTISTSGGYVTVAGNPSAGTISSNGNGQIGGLTSNGLFLYGKGSTYDLVLANATTNTALAIPTGTHNVLFSPNVGGGSSATLTVKTGSINSDSIRLEAGGTTSTWLESRGYLGHSWYVDSTRSMTLDSTGLGVGTASPAATLHLQHPSQSSGYWEHKGLLIHEDATADRGIALYSRGGSEHYIASLIDDANSYLIIGARKSSATNGINAITVRGSGNIGLGTDVPSQRLHVAGDVLIDNGTTSTLFFDADTNWMQLTSGDFRWGLGSAEKLRLTSAGLLGLGTSSPTSGVHISDGTAYGSPQNASRKATLTISAGTEASADLQFLNANYNHIFFGDSADANVGALLYDHTNNSMQFTTNGSERARILSSGGITFNGDTAAANALDDYEEGTWTPTINGGTVSTYSARYTKIGNTVTVSCYLHSISPTNNSSTFYVGGLPYNTSSASSFYHAGQIGYSGSATTEDLGLIGARNADHMYFHYLNSTNSGSAVTNAQIISRSIVTLIVSLTYTTD